MAPSKESSDGRGMSFGLLTHREKLRRYQGRTLMWVILRIGNYTLTQDTGPVFYPYHRSKVLPSKPCSEPGTKTVVTILSVSTVS